MKDRVVWRDGVSRDGAWESETFARQADAGRCRRDVDLAGQRWPDGWVHGVGFVSGEPATAEVAAPSLVEFGRGYVRDPTGITHDVGSTTAGSGCVGWVQPGVQRVSTP